MVAILQRRKQRHKQEKSLGYRTVTWWCPDLNPGGPTHQPVYSISNNLYSLHVN